MARSVASQGDFGTPAARERIVSGISPRYRGEMHFLGLLADFVVRSLERLLLQWRPTFTGR